MDKKIKEIIENEMDCLITDVDFVIKKEGSLQALVNMLEEAINYTRCSLQLKSKKAPTFEHWLICNFEETKTGKYIDFNNGETYRDKQVLKLKYNKIFKPTL